MDTRLQRALIGVLLGASVFVSGCFLTPQTEVVYFGVQVPLPDEKPTVYLFPAYLEAMNAGVPIDFATVLEGVTEEHLQKAVDNQFTVARYIALLEELIITHNESVKAREEEEHQSLFF